MITAIEMFYKNKIFETLENKEMTLTELSKKLNTPKSTTLRWVTLFKAKGLITTKYTEKINWKGRELLIKKSKPIS